MKAGAEPEAATVRDDLVELSRFLGDPARELAILGEGNVSASCGDGTFWVKASGSSLGTLAPRDVARVDQARVLAELEREGLDEPAIEEALLASRVAKDQRKPSVETFLHAVCIRHGSRVTAHTHPVAVNAVLCSGRGAEPFRRHVFPDAVVVCGREPAVVPYVDPGVALARAVHVELSRYRERSGAPPKVLLLENHGLVALGASAREASNITLMMDKWARILLGTFALGGPAYLPEDEVVRIDGRLDEQYRRRRLEEEVEP